MIKIEAAKSILRLKSVLCATESPDLIKAVNIESIHREKSALPEIPVSRQDSEDSGQIASYGAEKAQNAAYHADSRPLYQCIEGNISPSLSLARKSHGGLTESARTLTALSRSNVPDNILKILSKTPFFARRLKHT